jgi:transposase
MSDTTGVDDPAWNRRPGESAKAYEAARIYFEMRAARSLAGVAKNLGKSVSLVERWSTRWAWVDRATAFDAHLDRQEQVEFEREAKARKAKWRQRAEEGLDEKYELGQSFKNKAAKMVSFPLTSVVKEDGKTTIHAPKWTFKDAASLAKTGIRLSEEAIENALGEVGSLVPEEYITEDYK